MLRKLLDKLPHVKVLKREIETGQTFAKHMTSVNLKIIKEKQEISKENSKLKSYIGYLINENHAVMQDHHGRHVVLDPERLKKHEDEEVTIRQCPPLNVLILYSKKKVNKDED